MTASEKLKALRDPLDRAGGLQPEVVALLNALPQIVAAVKALEEQLTTMPGCICYTDLSQEQGTEMWMKHEDVLAALEKALP